MENCELFDIKPYLLLKSKNKWFDLALEGKIDYKYL